MPVTTRRQAQHARETHAQSHLNLNNLPTEIIDEIAFHLTSDSREPQETGIDSPGFDDVDVERMSVTSFTEEEGPPDIEVMPCCRPGDEEADWYDSRIPILDDRSTFSATSKRIRDIVFHRRETRRRTIRYCGQWVQETQELPLAIRSRYTNIRILANERHNVNYRGRQLIPLVQCFPNVETLSISWSILHNAPRPGWQYWSLKPNHGSLDGLPQVRRLQILLHSDFENDVYETCDETIYEVLNLMEHLPLIHVKDLGLFFESFMDSDKSGTYHLFNGLDLACKAMQCERLESFHLAFNFDVYGLPRLDLWVRFEASSFGLCSLTKGYRGLQVTTERMAQTILESTMVTEISFKPRLIFDSGDEVTRGVFTKTDKDVTLHPAYLPSRQSLVEGVGRLKARHPRLKTFKLVIEYNTFETEWKDLPKDNRILDFEYREDVEDQWPPLIRENMDLQRQQLEADDHRVKYRVYSSVIRACYDQLVQDAEALRQEVALEAATLQEALLPLEEVAGVANGTDGADGAD